MTRRTVAEARRSQLVSTFGVGALFPAQDESFMIVGLDDWPEFLCPVVAEPRLARSLGVATFRLPPSGSSKGQDLPVIRFPRLHHCPKCHRLGPLKQFGSWDENVHKQCQRTLTPSRFVVCCPKGHIDDFPYYAWVHKGSEQAPGQEHLLSLRTRGKTSSLDDIVVSCTCGVSPRSMAGSFGPQALRGVKRCSGERPWLRGSAAETCDNTPRTLQRGSSNVWFANTRSALSIPPWSEGVMAVVGKYWPVLEHVPAETLTDVLSGMKIPESSGLPLTQLVDAILAMRGEGGDETPSDDDLRAEEYQALVVGRPETHPQQQFVCTPVDGLEEAARELVAGVSEVSRLREVRALTGFHRVVPLDDADDADRHSSLSSESIRWLPAIEVLGEGVFLRIAESALASWEDTDFARQRAGALNAAYEARARQSGIGQAVRISARELALHSLAHILLSELSLDAGYPVASLRERVYSGPGQSGILVYTASADSAGSLGGLSAQAEPERLWSVLRAAVNRARWCSSDPVCVESKGSGVDALNLAACHACLLLPETSCERMNHVLDRASLVGLPHDRTLGLLDRFVR